VNVHKFSLSGRPAGRGSFLWACILLDGFVHDVAVVQRLQLWQTYDPSERLPMAEEL
jgi:hypothetical protein